MAKEKEPSNRLVLVQSILKHADKYERFIVLPNAAKIAFEAQRYEVAENYPKELLNEAAKYQDDWNYGNAIHDGNMVLGRLALRSGDTKLAAEYLLKAGNTPGSPQLNSFGPNMSLAKDLQDAGERDAVISYFKLCKKFWKLEDGRLESWSASIRGGGKPYYGTNLHY